MPLVWRKRVWRNACRQQFARNWGGRKYLAGKQGVSLLLTLFFEGKRKIMP
ncbi:hypothetical protein KKC1_27070 [Calderihabitans maritimus]|uniref:Uncharacterized protein n=1 Tax=Calderihabitans maritimus TaxID=1246530 RepID=A0A1Z5HW47_9FIRM|nr:hypothetical protein KKC1_27070 [Calderihabitans maritimus]